MEKVFITTGGTGGHIFPSLSLANELKGFIAPNHIVFLGGGLEKNPYFTSGDFPHHTVTTATFSLKNPLSTMKGLLALNQGIKESMKLMETHRPKLVVGFGSFHTLPVLIAAKLKKIPILLHEANAYPGKVNRLMSRFSETTGIQFPEAKEYLKGKTKIVSLPVRKEFKEYQAQEAKIALGLDPSKPTLLVFGGSQGALGINTWLEKLAPYLKSIIPGVQVIHLGSDTKIYEKEGVLAHVAPFSNQMDLCWSACDLAITRSGASTIAEMIHFAKPCIFIPYPFATNNHQERNASFVVQTIGGAVMKRQSELTLEWWVETLTKLFQENHKMLRAMESALLCYKRDFRSQSLLEMVKEWYER